VSEAKSRRRSSAVSNNPYEHLQADGNEGQSGAERDYVIESIQYFKNKLRQVNIQMA
jgi:hypothetical protein